MSQHDRIIGRNFTELVVQRKSFNVTLRKGIPFFLVPSTTSDELSWLSLFNSGCDHCNDLFPILYIHQVQLHLRIADSKKVAMAFNKAWNSQLALKIDDLGCLTDIRVDLLISANYNYLISTNP